MDLRNGVLDFGAEIVWWLRKLRKLIENETLKIHGNDVRSKNWAFCTIEYIGLLIAFVSRV
ncbi:hypothetical protein CFP56_026164 [Quercus suber]|uniref:Uncharacterized protein n=1 Tax=Quercus suber TaxID=58331 RepID=A0AAW0K1L9_QUESU